MMSPRRVRRGVAGHATVEIGHTESRTGIIVQVGKSRTEVRTLLERAFDVAGRQLRRGVTDPGWWAACVCAAGIEMGLSPSVQRVPSRGEVHVLLAVERGRMVEDRPPWPLVQLRIDGPWLDLRGEAALRLGPSDDELRAYADGAGVDAPAFELARMFELGVLEWTPGAAPLEGRRLVRAAIH